MTCPRCNGMMVPDYYYSDTNSCFQDWAGYRCISCGNVIDQIILVHRTKETLPKP